MSSPRRSGPTPITVLIVDDDAAVRTALAASVLDNGAFEIAGLAGTAEEAVVMAAHAQPQVALVDFHMPGGGDRAVRGILECSPQTHVVALSGSSDHATVLEMLRAGAASYVVKGGNPGEMIETILRSARGESFLSAEVADKVIGAFAADLQRREIEEGAARSVLERIRRVIDEELFEPVFQPIVDLTSGETAGFEALSRFSMEPTRTPDLWFAEARSAGLLTELELAAAHLAARRFNDAGQGGYLSLNASPETLPSCHELVGDVGRGRIVIEITEHAAIDDYGALAPALSELRGEGARVAVDDAGAGFASLRHALHVAPDFIKLDVSLTRGIDGDRSRRALATGLIGFADELGASIIAEGVETRNELDALRSLGVGYAQGFFLARPAARPQVA